MGIGHWFSSLNYKSNKENLRLPVQVYTRKASRTPTVLDNPLQANEGWFYLDEIWVDGAVDTETIAFCHK